MIEELIADKERLLRTIELMKSGTGGVGLPITTLDGINKATTALIASYENTVREIDAVLGLIDRDRKAKARK